MSLDSYARYLLNINQLPVAQKMYEKALQISNDVQGETHPQVTCTVLAGLLGKERPVSQGMSGFKKQLGWHQTCTALNRVLPPCRAE